MISKDIYANYPPSITPPAPSLLRAATLKLEPSILGDDEFGRLPGKEGVAAPPKSEYAGKADCYDNLFMEDVSLD